MRFLKKAAIFTASFMVGAFIICPIISNATPGNIKSKGNLDIKNGDATVISLYASDFKTVDEVISSLMAEVTIY